MQSASWHDLLCGCRDAVGEQKTITEVRADDLLRAFDCQCFVNGAVIYVGCSRRARAKHLTGSRNPLESRAQSRREFASRELLLLKLLCLPNHNFWGVRPHEHKNDLGCDRAVALSRCLREEGRSSCCRCSSCC